MANMIGTRKQLLDRWRVIEEEEEDVEEDDAISSSTHRHLKEKWFSDAFNFLICLPKKNHIWCGSSDIMGPLLETFYNYVKDKHHDSPLKTLWKRISLDLQGCTQCISQHHQAQEMYFVEYDTETVAPLLDVLRCLDEERVTQQLKEINGRMARGEYKPLLDSAEVVSLMFEVLMFPILLDDLSLVTEFEKFVEWIDHKHEVTLSGHQQYPGVYALLFSKSRRVRAIGHRLAGSMGKLRSAAELDPLQPLLKKCIGFLLTEVLPSTFETSRPRVQLERIPVWLGIKALLGFLEPAAFEKGILEQYPTIFSIVLNHISDDSLEFSHAVICLRLLFELLGCKLWLKSTLSPSVMRNTLLGQCFHTQNEKSHKEIFDLFEPFLQSLEALQDGEHEEQRRNFLYFLLYQVPVSSNFSVLMRKKACQIALIIVHRGYKMNPPCPPFECAHMWGPALVSSLKDSSLHISLRQPALDLIQNIMISDASALIYSLLNNSASLNIDGIMLVDLDEEEDDKLLPLSSDVGDNDIGCWGEFSALSKIVFREFSGWMCIPMLWIDVLVEIDPSLLPVSFSKAVFWARSRFTLAEPENSAEMEVMVRTWLSSSAAELSASFCWKIPTGSDDCGEGKESKNSVKVSTMHLPLIRTFKRLTAHFLVHMEQGALQKRWTWESRMGEGLILLLLDSNDKVRHVSRCLLEQVSSTRGLVSGLQFLCSSAFSLSAVFMGLRHAFKMVQLDSVLLNFQTLHNFFFVLCKLLKEGGSSSPYLSESSFDELTISQFSSQGGFLKQTLYELSPSKVTCHTSNLDTKSLKLFSSLVSESAWPSVCKCLVEGKAFIDNKISQMSCVRLLEILPVVFEMLCPSDHNFSGKSRMVVDNVYDFRWLHDLIDWGNSSLDVVVRYWKHAVKSLLEVFKGLCSNNTLMTIKVIENLISHDCVSMDELAVHVSLLSISLSNEACCNVENVKLKPKYLFSEGLSFERYHSTSRGKLFLSENADVQILKSAAEDGKREGNKVIVLSDDESQKQTSPYDAMVPPTRTTKGIVKNTLTPCIDSDLSRGVLSKGRSATDTSKSLEAFPKRDTSSHKLILEASIGKLPSAPLHEPKGLDTKSAEKVSKSLVIDSPPSYLGATLNKSVDEPLKSSHMDHTHNDVVCNDTIIKKVVLNTNTENDLFEHALRSGRRQDLLLEKPIKSVPKRQVIQINLPTNRPGYSHRLEAGIKRFSPPNLDDWYKPILGIDYFATVGLSSVTEGENHTLSKLKEVPVCFQSPEEYIDIFRPFLLEEFKAQLHSSFLEMSSMEMFVGNLSVMSIERIDDFHLVRFVYDENNLKASWSLSDNDLVVLTKQPLQTSSHDIHLVGKVEKREKVNKQRSSILIIRFYLQNGCSRVNRARSLLLERSKWYVTRVMSITPQLREFQALTSSREIPILGTILKPGHDSHGYKEPRKADLSKLPHSLQTILESSYNNSQLQAISVAIQSSEAHENFGLSLIQGPPGTGKTRTIVAIVSALLASPLQMYSKKSLNGSTKSSGSTKPSDNPFTNLRQKISQSVAIARAWQDAALAIQLNEGEVRCSKPVVNSARGRVLICAQSNAAVDELVARISSGGLFGSDGNMYKPYIVRVGNVKTVHPNSLPFFIDTLVDQRLGEEAMNVSKANAHLSGETSMELRSNIEKLVDRIRFYEAKRANLRDGNSSLKSSVEDKDPMEGERKEMSEKEIEAKLKRLYEQKQKIYKDLATTQAREKKSYEETKTLKYKLRKSILKEAEIVVATLSGCGGDLYGVCSESSSGFKFGHPSENSLFDAVVIDEAAQALEPATLIPLQLLKSNGTKCIMVGDPKQLPATVLSNIASKFQYQCSMFERLQRAGHPVVMLNEQYRMHPDICRFPSFHFYDSKLLNGVQMSSKSAPFHETEGLGPYVFFDVIDGQELHGKSTGALSLYNECEVDAAVEVLSVFRKRYPSQFVTWKMGIITPYKSQLSLLRLRFSSVFGSTVTENMEFNTVDGFQGREVDILILSTVRAGDSSATSSGVISSNIGFVADVRRMNVSLTRAKFSLWILGNTKTLQTNHHWAALIKDAKDRNLVISSKRPYKSMFNKTSRNLLGPENSDDHSRSLKDGEIERSTCRSSQMGTGEETYERKNTNAKCNKRTADVRHDLSPRRGVVQRDRKKSRREHNSSAVNAVTIGENATGCEHKGKGYSKKNPKLGNNDKITRSLDPCRQETSAGHKILKSQGSSEPSKSSKRERSEGNSDILVSSTAGDIPLVDTNVRSRVHKHVDTQKDIIAKRKQQREAVEALLPSGLIASKKTEKSMAPLPSIATGTIKPPKSGKVRPVSSSSARGRPH